MWWLVVYGSMAGCSREAASRVWRAAGSGTVSRDEPTAYHQQCGLRWTSGAVGAVDRGRDANPIWALTT